MMKESYVTLDLILELSMPTKNKLVQLVGLGYKILTLDNLTKQGCDNLPTFICILCHCIVKYYRSPFL